MPTKHRARPEEKPEAIAAAPAGRRSDVEAVQASPRAASECAKRNSDIEGGRKPGGAEALRRVASALGVAIEHSMRVAVDDGAPGFDGTSGRDG